VRLAYRLSFLLFVVSGWLAASLARDFSDLSDASRRWGALVVPLQLPVVIVWAPARMVSLASFAVCSALAERLA
jgi:hypothetical protein